MSECQLGWGDIEPWVRALARVPSPDGGQPFERILGVARGGLIPAALLAQQMGVPLLESIQVRLYRGAQRAEGAQISGARPAAAGPSGDPRRTLIIDEIVDSGETFAALAALYPRATYAALLGRHAAERGSRAEGLLYVQRAYADGCPGVWFAHGVTGEDWILFPWSPDEDRAGT